MKARSGGGSHRRVEKRDRVRDPYADVDAYLALPRTVDLLLSPDGARLVAVVTTSDAEGPNRRALWVLDPRGHARPQRLPGGCSGPSPVFLPDGRLVMSPAQPPDPTGAPVGSGGSGALAIEPGHTLALPDGLVPVALAAARCVPRLVVLASPPRGAAGAVLHATHPTRFWDAELGTSLRLLVLDVPPDAADVVWREIPWDESMDLRDADLAVSADGRTLLVTSLLAESGVSQRRVLGRLDVDTGAHVVLADDGSSHWERPVLSPDGACIAVVRETRGSPRRPLERHLVLLPTTGASPPRRLVPEWDRWPVEVCWTPDGSSLLVTADDGGHRPLFRVPLDGSAATPVSRWPGHLAAVRPTPEGSLVYALHDTVAAPPEPVAVRLSDGQRRVLCFDGLRVPTPRGHLADVVTRADDGVTVRGWLLLPACDGPHALVTWLHGGPLSSWNAWSWRGNPWPLVARGYAVLLPDPCPSTGYGAQFVARGWGAWGGQPPSDVLALIDAAAARPDIDGNRMALLGGSFGGYLANWLAGRDRRFRAVVSHAGIWDLVQFVATSDLASRWSEELSPERQVDHSPSRYSRGVRPPTLLVHGGRDYRVPVTESLRQWWEVLHRAGEDPSPHRFLHFPDENHFVLHPKNSGIWLRTVLGFLDEHLSAAPSME